MSEALKKDRPQYRNINITDLMRYRMPSSAKVSILHRISGAIIFLLLPFILWLLDLSLTSETTFEAFKGAVSGPIGKLVVLVLAWGYIHHFCAGVRHLFLDMHFAPGKENAHRTANITLVITIVLTLLVAAKLFGVF